MRKAGVDVDRALLDMTTAPQRGARPPAWYWPVSGLFLVWSVLVSYDVAMTHLVGETYLRRLGVDPVVIAFVQNTSAWADLIGIAGTASSLVGSVLLVARRAGAEGAFALSLATLLASSVYLYGIADAGRFLGWGGVFAQGLAWGQGLLFFAYARHWRRVGVLR